MVKDYVQAKNMQEFKYSSMLSNTVTTVINEYKNAMETDIANSDGLTPSQLHDLHKCYYVEVLSLFEPLMAQYPMDVWKPYIDQAKVV
jgi:hypothetical protein